MARIWIDAGCIQCGWCENLEPKVFTVSAEGCRIIGSSRIDGRTDVNGEAGSDLIAGLLDDEGIAYLPFIAGGCPVEVIKLSGIAAVDDPLGARSIG